MNEIYTKLNYYLNEICCYLEKEEPFFLENLRNISILNDKFLTHLVNYSFDNKVIQNNLSFEEVFNLARTVIEKIDKSYLESFNNLIKSGELNFSYENEYLVSECVSYYKNDEVIKRIININRQFNYNDVKILVHEFIYYINYKNKNYLAEFLSIYFEFYTTEYLLKSGINREEIDYLDRIKNCIKDSTLLYNYDIVLLAYVKFGNLNENTITFLQKFIVNIKKEFFEKECRLLYIILTNIEKYYRDKIEKEPKLLAEYMCNEFISQNYKYVLGTILAIYAKKYCDFDKIVYLNNHICEYDNQSFYDVCLSIGIDLNDNNFFQNLFSATDELIEGYKLIIK